MRTKIAVLALTYIYASILTGCEAPNTQVFYLQQDDTHQAILADQPADRRAILFVPTKKIASDGTITMAQIPCPAPPPDIGFSRQQLMELAANLPNRVDATGMASSISTLAELKGRTPAVLALRDVMSIACVTAAGGTMPAAEMADLLDRVVGVIGTFAEADRAHADRVAPQADIKPPALNNTATM